MRITSAHQRVFFPVAPKLPPEIFSLIVTFLDPTKDFKNVNLTCRRWYKALKEPFLWKFLLQRDFSFKAHVVKDFRVNYQRIAAKTFLLKSSFEENKYIEEVIKLDIHHIYFLEITKNFFVYGDDDETVKIRDQESQRIIAIIDIPLSNSSRSYVRDDILYISCSGLKKNCIYRIDLNTRKVLPQIPNVPDFIADVFKIHNKMLIAGGRTTENIGKIVIFDLEGRQEPKTLLLDGSVSVRFMEPSHGQLTAVTANGDILKWDLEDLKKEKIPKGEL